MLEVKIRATDRDALDLIQLCASLLIRQFDRAIEQFREALDLDPHELMAHRRLGYAYVQTGKVEEGLRSAEMGLQLSRQSPTFVQFAANIYASAGRTDEAQKRLEELLQLRKKAYVSPFMFAGIYHALGDIDKCFDWLAKAVEEHDSLIIPFYSLYFHDPLRTHPRFQALLRKMNLEP